MRKKEFKQRFTFRTQIGFIKGKYGLYILKFLVQVFYFIFRKKKLYAYLLILCIYNSHENIRKQLQNRSLPTPIHPSQHDRIQRFSRAVREVKLHVFKDSVILDFKFPDFHFN